MLLHMLRAPNMNGGNGCKRDDWESWDKLNQANNSLARDMSILLGNFASKVKREPFDTTFFTLLKERVRRDIREIELSMMQI